MIIDIIKPYGVKAPDGSAWTRGLILVASWADHSWTGCMTCMGQPRSCEVSNFVTLQGPEKVNSSGTPIH
jgi:hypothetical protein